MKIGIALVISVVLFGCNSGDDADIAAAKSTKFGQSTVTEAKANSNAGASLTIPKYLPNWGPYYPNSIIGSKLVQRMPDGKGGRVTTMITTNSPAKVVDFYRNAIKTSGLNPDFKPFGNPKVVQFMLGTGNSYQTDRVMVSDQSWKNSDGSIRTKVEIQIFEALPRP